MKNWIKENLGKSFTAFGLVIAIASFIVGVYFAQHDIKNDLQIKETKIESLKQQIRELKDDDIWYIKQWISNPSNYR